MGDSKPQHFFSNSNIGITMKKSKKAAPKGQPALVEKQPLKIAIVGTASTSVGEAPWKDESWQIWSLGRNSENCPRYNQWFELHTKDVLSAAGALDNRLPFLKSCGSRLIVGHKWEELPEAQMYPWAAIIHLFGTYLTSSLAEMIALAITQNPAEIGVWGVDMVCPDEYAHQRSCCEYLLGIAKGKGIKVTVAKESPLLRGTRVYGFEDAGFSREIIERIGEANAQLKQDQVQLSKLQEDFAFKRGVLSVLRDLETRWC